MKRIFWILAILIIPSFVFSQGVMVFDRAADIVFTPAGDIAAVEVQSAIEEVDSEKQALLVNSAGLISALDDETGSGLAVFSISPVFTTPNIGSATGNITGNAGTATALAADGANCTDGYSPLGVDASGAVESCFDVWTEAENTAAGYTANVGDFLADGSVPMTGALITGHGSILANATASGVVTLGGTGGTNDENLLLNFETVANTIKFDSSSEVDTFEFGADISVQAGDLAMDCDGDATTTVGTCDFAPDFDARFTLMGDDTIDYDGNDIADGVYLCTANLGAASRIRVDLNQDCTDNGGTDGTYIFGPAAPCNAKVTSAWGFIDEDADGLLDNGEDLYIDKTPTTTFYNGGAGDIYALHRIYLENGEYIQNSTNEEICVVGAEDICFQTNAGTNEVGMRSRTGASLIRFGFGINIGNDVYMSYGSGPDAQMGWETTGNRSLQIGTRVNAATASGYVSLMEYGGMGNVNRSPLAYSANPVFRGYSSDTTIALDYWEITHNQADVLFNSGAGDIKFDPAGGELIITDGSKLQVNSLGDDKSVQLSQDGTNGVISGDGSLDIQMPLITDAITSSGAVDLSSAFLELPNSAGPAVGVEGRIAYDTDDEALEVFDGVNSRLIPTVHTIQKTIIDPSSMQSAEDAVPLFYVHADAYPGGIKLLSIQMGADQANSAGITFEEWSNTTTHLSDIETITFVSSTGVADDGSLADSDIASGNWIFADLDTTDLNFLSIAITYWIKEND